ncbi:hypothetical protein B0H99_104241 [Planomicrobium soli]|uniref:Uncharacterized protein n=1 Tax=Planomicrobium soli TaxID=1176648 RepID=A0A2P8H3J0_9BACL|nr:hypothetical protein [Planomicrobium soli]PSL40779.1 hypothetical protein B0H99_104241 [Planomicrobium soli]
MAVKEELVLVLEEYKSSFKVCLLGRDGTTYSSNYFKEMPEVAEVRSLIGTLTHIFGNFNRITYSKNFTTIWDHEARPDSFGKFMAELFASKEDSSTNKYRRWEHFSEFLEEQEEVVHQDRTKDLPF